MSQALYILEASLMTVQKTYKDYSSNSSVHREDSGIMIDVRLQLLITIVFPVLLNAAETWTVNKEDEKRLLAFEMRCYRRILAVKWENRRTNEEIRAVVQRKETVVDTIRMRKLQLFGHICRTPDDQLLKVWYGILGFNVPLDTV